MKIILKTSVLLFLFLAACKPLLATANEPGESSQQQFSDWLDEFKKEALSQGISQATIDSALADAKPLDKVLTLYEKQPENTKTFQEYRKLVLTPQKIEKGRSLYRKNKKLLDAVGKKYNVQPGFITALWGIETNYGKNTGNFNIISSLATLAYGSRRPDFYKDELIKALRIVDQKNIKAHDLIGSWAGAMGQSQFMPSSYLAFAVDENNDGKADIWHTEADVFASIANYLTKSGWNPDNGWGIKVMLPENFDMTQADLKIEKNLKDWETLGIKAFNGDALPDQELKASLVNLEEDKGSVKAKGEYYLVFPNYKVLMKWNRSTYFATIVSQLADKIEGPRKRVAKAKSPVKN